MKRFAIAVAVFLLIPVPAFAAPAVKVSPSSLNFGSQCVSAQANSLSVRITNSGSDPLTISAVSIAGQNPGDFAIKSGGPKTLPPNGSTVVDVNFTPQAAGSRSATLRIDSNASSSPDQVPLSGQGVTRQFDVSPDHLDFGNQRVGTTSDTLQLSLSNSGTDPVTIDSISLGGQAADYIIASSGAHRIPPGQSSAVAIAFRPQKANVRTAALIIQSDACAGKTSVALTGNGTEPKIQVAPGSVVFGAISIGSTSEGLPMVVSNVGRAPLVIRAIAVEGPHANDFRFTSLPDLPKVLGPGEEFPVNALFVPSATGARTAALRISSDDPNYPAFIVPLSGNVSGASASLQPIASQTPQSESASPSDTPSGVAIGNHSAGGFGDWLAIGLVCLMVASIFGTLLVIRRRRELT